MIPDLPCATCVQIYALTPNWRETCQYRQRGKCTYCERIPGKECPKVPLSLDVQAREILYLSRLDDRPTEYLKQLGLDFRKNFLAHQGMSNPAPPTQDDTVYNYLDSDSTENIEPELNLPPESEGSEYQDSSSDEISDRFEGTVQSDIEEDEREKSENDEIMEEDMRNADSDDSEYADDEDSDSNSRRSERIVEDDDDTNDDAEPKHVGGEEDGSVSDDNLSPLSVKRAQEDRPWIATRTRSKMSQKAVSSSNRRQVSYLA